MSKALVAISALILLAIGFGLGQHFSSDPAPQAPLRSTGTYVAPTPPSRAETAPPRDVAAGETLEAVLADPDLYSRVSRLAVLLETLGPEHVPAVRKRLESKSTSDEMGVEMALLAAFWTAHEPQRAAFWAMHEAPAGFRPGVILASIEIWARNDPKAAADLVTGTMFTGSASTKLAQVAVVRGWYESGQPGLGEYIRDIGRGFERQRALGALSHRVIERDGPETMIRWVEALPNEDVHYKTSAFRQLSTRLTIDDPAIAVAFCEAHCDGSFGSGVRKRIAQEWAEKDGPATMAWVSTAPPGLERKWAVKAALRGWWRSDREGLTRWMEEMGPEGVETWFQPALRNWAVWSGRRSGDFESAMKWIDVMEDEKLREAAAVDIARRWREVDPEAAEAWLAQSYLSEDARSRARLPRKSQKPPPRQTSAEADLDDPESDDPESDDPESDDPESEQGES